MLIEILDEPKLIVNFNNFALIINYNNTSYAKDLDDILINILFIKSRFAIKDDNLLIAKDNNKKLIKKLDSSLNSF